MDLSNDGTKIVFFDESVALYVVNTDGTNLRNIMQGSRGCWPILSDLSCLRVPGRSINDFRDQRPRWSPDDQKILFIAALNYPSIINENGSDGNYSLGYLNNNMQDNPATQSASWSPVR